jgi:hypothetical protein
MCELNYGASETASLEKTHSLWGDDALGLDIRQYVDLWSCLGLWSWVLYFVLCALVFVCQEGILHCSV